MAVEAVNVTAATTDAQITSSGFSRLFGWSVHETAAGVATGVLRNGTATTDTALAYYSLAAAGSQTVWFGPQGIAAPKGIFLDRTAGTTQITVFVG